MAVCCQITLDSLLFILVVLKLLILLLWLGDSKAFSSVNPASPKVTMEKWTSLIKSKVENNTVVK